MIHEEICTYEVCKLAKEKGFDVPTHYAYNENCRKAMYMELCLNRNTKDSRSISAPTQSLLQRWLREEKGVFIEIRSDVNEKLGRITSRYNIVCDYDGRSSSVHICCDEYFTYELALEDALKYALENLV